MTGFLTGYETPHQMERVAEIPLHICKRNFDSSSVRKISLEFDIVLELIDICQVIYLLFKRFRDTYIGPEFPRIYP